MIVSGFVSLFAAKSTHDHEGEPGSTSCAAGRSGKRLPRSVSSDAMIVVRLSRLSAAIR
jgi:hypothetical protein